MRKIKSIIVDDEKNSRENLHYLLQKYCPQVDVIAEANSVNMGVELIGKLNPQLVFLDIEMPNGGGFHLLEKIPNISFNIIFVTAYDQYAIRAFKFSALDYLLKPINTIELQHAIDRASYRILERSGTDVSVLMDNLGSLQQKKLVLPGAKEHTVVTLNEIIRCESDNYYTWVYLTNGKRELISKTLKEYDELLTDSGFYRVHQSHLVNAKHIRSVRKGQTPELQMSDEAIIPIAQRRKDLIKQIIKEIGK